MSVVVSPGIYKQLRPTSQFLELTPDQKNKNEKYER